MRRIKKRSMSKYMFRRYLLFIVSLFVNAFGIAFITRALLGTSPITSVTYVLSMFTPYTMGIWTILLNLLFVVLEMFLMTRQELKSDLRMFLLQIPISFCFGLFIDFSMLMLSWLQPISYLTILSKLVGLCKKNAFQHSSILNCILKLSTLKCATLCFTRCHSLNSCNLNMLCFTFLVFIIYTSYCVTRNISFRFWSLAI